MTAAYEEKREPRLWIGQCPFCGNHRLMFRPWADGRIGVQCRTCGARLPERSPERLVLYWNRAFRNIPQDLARVPVAFRAVDNAMGDARNWKAGGPAREVHSRKEYYSVISECRAFFARHPYAGQAEIKEA